MMSFCQELFERDVNVVLVNSNLKRPSSLHNIHSVQGEFQKLFMEMAFLQQQKNPDKASTRTRIFFASQLNTVEFIFFYLSR